MQRVVLASAGSSRRHLDQPRLHKSPPARVHMRDPYARHCVKPRPTDPIASNLEGWRSPSVCAWAKPVTAFGRQTGGSLLGSPLGHKTRVQGSIHKGLRGLRAGRDADGAGADPRCAGLPISVDRIDVACSTTNTRHTRIVEHVGQMFAQRQRMRRSDPGDASTDHRNLLSYTRCHAADNTRLRFIMGSQVVNAQ